MDQVLAQVIRDFHFGRGVWHVAGRLGAGGDVLVETDCVGVGVGVATVKQVGNSVAMGFG